MGGAGRKGTSFDVTRAGGGRLLRVSGASGRLLGVRRLSRQSVDETPPAPSVNPPPAAEPEAQPRPRASRRRREGGGTQSRRARIILEKMFPDGYPTRDEVSDLELYDQFEKEWKKEK